MKKSRKIMLGVATVAAVVAGGVGLAAAWGDSDGGRPSYTVNQINQGVLGDRIIFNTLRDGVIGDEKNFVNARLDDGQDQGADTQWEGDTIAAEDGKTYLIRLYVHNNNPKGEQAVAENVRTAINIPDTSGKTIDVNGFITSSNASPNKYWDSIRFTSNSNFHLEYVAGSAGLANNGIGANGGIQLSDDITTQNGVLIGYHALDGRIPGCFQYASYVGIRVKVKYDDQPFLVEKQVRKAGETTDWRANWTESVNTNVGDEVEYRIHYKNTTAVSVKDVMVKDVLPNNMSYVDGSTYLYSSTHQDGFQLYDDIVTKGVNIGDYSPKGDGYVIFKAKVNDDSLICGNNTLTNWGQVTAGDQAYQDPADVIVNKECDTNFKTDKTVRLAGNGEWKESIDAHIGDEVEYRIQYQNTGNTKNINVNIKDILPEGVKFVPGTAKIYDSNRSGEAISDDIVTTGVNIGDYEAGQSAYITFTAKIVDESLVCGANTLTNTENTTVGGTTLGDIADVKVRKDCPVTPDTPTEMPATGPTEIAAGIIGAGAVTTAAGYYIASRKKSNR